MMKKITEIDVQSMADEIDHNVWEPTAKRKGHGKQWIGTEVQTLIRHVEPVSYTHLTLPTIYSV